ncbi:glucose dehydrogenase [FAD, quinone]-like [Ylistrum balloti]|uniref:glucose dehydrogenase [FAD, quinone]-like n=1 Tax=Ylistrum balloti TaxID=509963 RepID=UPI0029059DB3|nr:glucose dehydrogenase [FAD, quinone]-like [Ylistrum balloti]
MDRFVFTTCLSVAVALLYSYRSTEHRAKPITLNDTYDYIIVGAGSSGSVVAGRLTEDPTNHVLLVEAGGSDDESPHILVPGEAMLLLESEQDWGYRTEPQKHACFAQKQQKSYWPRGKVLGGSSSLNWLSFVRGNPHDYDSWAEEGCEGWSYKDVLPYFIKSEAVQVDEYKSDYRGTNGPIPISRSDLTPIQQLYLKAGRDLGYNTVDCNGEDQIGFSWMQSNIKNGERWNNYRSFVKSNIDRPNLHVSTNTFTTKILIDKKKAIGIEYIKNGRKYQSLARKEVILSAGAVNSPQLLMLSGVGPKEHLEELGIKVEADLPVGNNLQDHLLAPLTFPVNVTSPITLEKLTSRWTRMQYDIFGKGYLSGTFGEGVAFVYDDFDLKKDAGRTSDIQLHFFSAHIFPPSMKGLVNFNFKKEIDDKIFLMPEDVLSVSFFPILLHPKSRGTIRLKTTDPFDYPEIDPHYLEHPDDVKMLIRGIRFVEKLVGTQTMRSIGIDVNYKSPLYHLCSQHEFRSDSFWECYARQYTLTVFHPTSGCRMGAMSDKTAVVDSNLRVKGISGLRVVDASVMRNVPAGNTNAPATMIGEKAADIILRQTLTYVGETVPGPGGVTETFIDETVPGYGRSHGDVNRRDVTQTREESQRRSSVRRYSDKGGVTETFVGETVPGYGMSHGDIRRCRRYSDTGEVTETFVGETIPGYGKSHGDVHRFVSYTPDNCSGLSHSFVTYTPDNCAGLSHSFVSYTPDNCAGLSHSFVTYTPDNCAGLSHSFVTYTPDNCAGLSHSFVSNTPDNCAGLSHSFVSYTPDNCAGLSHSFVTYTPDNCAGLSHSFVTYTPDNCAGLSHSFVTYTPDNCAGLSHSFVSYTLDNCAVLVWGDNYGGGSVLVWGYDCGGGSVLVGGDNFGGGSVLVGGDNCGGGSVLVWGDNCGGGRILVWGDNYGGGSVLVWGDNCGGGRILVWGDNCGGGCVLVWGYDCGGGSVLVSGDNCGGGSVLVGGGGGSVRLIVVVEVYCLEVIIVVVEVY